MRALVIGACLLPLAGCVGSGVLGPGFAAMKGQPAEAAIQRLGFPDNKYQVGDETAYVWDRSTTGQMPIPANPFPNAAFGGGGGLGSVTFSCRVRFIAGPDGIIKRGDFRGNLGGCARYSRALNSGAH
jgi:hypothetical protein